jgi:hypothetical protein
VLLCFVLAGQDKGSAGDRCSLQLCWSAGVCWALSVYVCGHTHTPEG